ncbi:hypothetical protein CU669_09970 [Paramagnetospirillum kuznetsovii]|uniref:Uncharacterized protein n=1 Tax=Paramagnetospirillum kuznetsovii TaxID=2053833 RepID=A0A364NY47_9PROT|nr:hypothetical protein CU669_09970 [Paramagnetospirillum kuznetsovii]
MIPAKDEYCHCPHCNRETRHSIIRERVLAPVLWCLSCYRTRVGFDVQPSASGKQRRAAESERAGQPFRMAG